MGRKRPIVVDVEGSPIVVEVHAALVQDRGGAPAVIVALLEVAVYVEKLLADSGYAGPKLHDALKELGVSELIEIVPKPKGAKGFTVLSRRWVVERTFGWMGRCRRLAKDVERTVASSLAWVKLAGCRFMMRRVARCQRPRNSALHPNNTERWRRPCIRNRVGQVPSWWSLRRPRHAHTTILPSGYR